MFMEEINERFNKIATFKETNDMPNYAIELCLYTKVIPAVGNGVFEVNLVFQHLIKYVFLCFTMNRAGKGSIFSIPHTTFPLPLL